MNRRLAYPAAQCLVAALLFGASPPLAKMLLGSVGPFRLAGLLYLGAAVAMLPFAFRGRSLGASRGRREWLLLGAAVLFGGGLGPVLLLLGLQAAAAASVSLWLNLETAATALLAWTLFREHLDRRTVLAAALILAGGTLLAIPGGSSGVRAGALVALACLCWGVDNNCTALIGGFTPAQTTLVKGLVAGSVNFALGLFVEPATPPVAAAVLGLAVGGVSYGISILLYISGAQQLGATRSQLLFSTSPFWGVVLAWIALGEPLLILQFAAGAVMVAGLWLMLGARHEHEHTHERLAHTHSHRHDDGHHNHVHPGLPAWVRHTHPHEHEPLTHTHPHEPDLHHRHEH